MPGRWWHPHPARIPSRSSTSAPTLTIPKIVVDLPLMNSIFGPLTNLAITLDGKLAGRQLDALGAGRLGLEAATRQQGPRHRS